MKFKPVFFCLVFLLFFCFIAQADSFDLAKPQVTKLTHKETKKLDETTITVVKYSSRLSKDKIVDFYRGLLARKNMAEDDSGVTNKDIENTYVFVGDARKVTVFFLPSREGEETKYSLFIYEYDSPKGKTAPKSFIGNLKNQKNLKAFGYVSDPRKVDFMPLYAGVKQLEYINWSKSRPPAISIGYVSRQDFSAVIDFYLNEMPSYGWSLTGQEPHQGVYSVSEWVPMIAPDTNFCYTCEEKEILPEKVPPLKIRGMTLTFMKGSQKCIITAHTFDDIIQQARKTNYDIIFMEDYGTTIIGVVYSY